MVVAFLAARPHLQELATAGPARQSRLLTHMGVLSSQVGSGIKTIDTLESTVHAQGLSVKALIAATQKEVSELKGALALTQQQQRRGEGLEDAAAATSKDVLGTSMEMMRGLQQSLERATKSAASERSAILDELEVVKRRVLHLGLGAKGEGGGGGGLKKGGGGRRVGVGGGLASLESAKVVNTSAGSAGSARNAGNAAAASKAATKLPPLPPPFKGEQIVDYVTVQQTLKHNDKCVAEPMGMGDNSVKYHAENGQDVWLDQNVFKGRTNLTFLEFGSADGWWGSNTATFQGGKSEGGRHARTVLLLLLLLLSMCSRMCVCR
jgi:hypothetical protein